jgi:NADH:ubiquinone oxidoreductase subunit K/NADH:ubiquinone oxidoreductase subunit 6 (subunit J)
MTTDTINWILLAATVAAALGTMLTARLLRAAIGLAVTSALLAVVMFRLNAPLAGVFELSVCAGLIPAIFISAISLTRRQPGDDTGETPRHKVMRLAFLPAIVVLVGLAMSQVHVPAEFATAAAVRETDVRAVLWNLRHIDLLGQGVVLLGGAFAVVVLVRRSAVSPEMANVFSIFGIGVALILVIGLYGILTTRNLIGLLIALEVLTKGVTLLLIAAGYCVGQLALAQALAITLIVVEVAIVVVAVGLALGVFRQTGALDVSSLRNLKG